MARMSGERLRRRSPEIVEASDHLSSGSTELHVLAVDDSFVDRKVIERLLKISSCRVTAVESGRRALQYLGLDGEKNSVGFDALKVNLIMTDYSMPGMTGYELLKKIKESSTLREIPVVVMSSENILARIDRCLEEGAEDFLVKPVQLSDVKRLKDFILRGQGEESGKKRSHKRKPHDDFMPSSLQSNQPPASMPSPLPPLLQSPSKRLSSQPSTSTPCPLFPSKLPCSQPSTCIPCPLLPLPSPSPHSKRPRL